MKWKNRNPNLSNELSRLAGLEPFELLGVTTDATMEEIKSAYRKLAKIYHPDKSDPFMKLHNEQVIKLINEAYKRLCSRVEVGGR